MRLGGLTSSGKLMNQFDFIEAMMDIQDDFGNTFLEKDIKDSIDVHAMKFRMLQVRRVISSIWDIYSFDSSFAVSVNKAYHEKREEYVKEYLDCINQEVFVTSLNKDEQIRVKTMYKEYERYLLVARLCNALVDLKGSHKNPVEALLKPRTRYSYLINKIHKVFNEEL